jgi:hypothetical protein
MRKREKVQEMPRSINKGYRRQRTEPSRTPAWRRYALSSILCSLFLSLASTAVFAQAPIFPDRIGLYEKHAPQTLALPDRELLTEYGLEATETAEYTTVPEAPEKKRFNATAWRLADSTYAYALYQSKRPPGATASDFSANAARTSDGVLFAFGNYVFLFTGGQPDPADLEFLYNSLPRFANAPLPILLGLFPKEGIVPNSERYILGPVSLQRFAPEIPPSTAAFRLGAEAQLVKYKNPKGDISLAVFSYPTPTMARDQTVEFQKLPMAMVKRTGSLIAVALNPVDRDTAERLLGRINYQADVTLNEKPAGADLKRFGGQLMSMVALAGILMCVCVIAGVGFGGFRVIAKKLRKGEDPGAMITLHLDR